MSRYSAEAIKGAGVGLRSQHYRHILERLPRIPWFEALSENYFGDGGQPLHYLEQVRSHYPVTLHGVGMSLGSTDPLDHTYLGKLKTLAERIEPAWISDHLAWIAADGRYVHDLLPLPYTSAALDHVSERLLQVQDFLGRPLLVENPSSYMTFVESDISEWEFLSSLTARTDCLLLLDVNNVYVSAKNHGFEPTDYIESLPVGAVREIHLAGYEEQQGYLFDTHGQQVHPPVWDLYRHALKRLGPVPTLIEWDTDVPEFEVLAGEARLAQAELDSIQ